MQQSISWESAHCQAHEELQDEGVGLLAGVEEDQADAQHGAHRDEQDCSSAVAILYTETEREREREGGGGKEMEKWKQCLSQTSVRTSD